MLRYILPGCIWLAIILLLSFTPGEELQQVNWNYFAFDKFAHIAVYAILVHIWLTGFKRQRSSKFLRKKAFLVVLSAAFVLGFFVEIIQAQFISGRVFDKFDILANTLGIITGTFGFYLLYRNYY